MTITDSSGHLIGAPIWVDFNNLGPAGIRLQPDALIKLEKLGRGLEPGLRVLLYDEDEPQNDLIALGVARFEASDGTWFLVPAEFAHESESSDEHRALYRQARPSDEHPFG
jgi:hypothetical protein